MRHANRALFVMVFAALAGAGWRRAPRRLQSAGSASGLPVPRFVSLKADKVNMHIGPAKTYEIKWLYQRAGLPVEITAEFENWRRIRDADGTEGWVYHSLLSGRRTGMVIAKTKDDLVPVYEKPDAESAVTAKLERGVVGTVKRCSRRGLVLRQRPRLRGLDPAGPAVGRLPEREGGLSWIRRHPGAGYPERSVIARFGASLGRMTSLPHDRRFHRTEASNSPITGWLSSTG